MSTSRHWSVRSALLRVGLGCLIAGFTAHPTSAVQTRQAAPQGYITGVVQSSQGPEAGVWVRLPLLQLGRSIQHARFR